MLQIDLSKTDTAAADGLGQALCGSACDVIGIRQIAQLLAEIGKSRRASGLADMLCDIRTSTKMPVTIPFSFRVG